MHAGVGSVGVGSVGIGSVGVESERLVAVLERAVDALELLATLPTPETTVSLAAFLLHAPDGNERGCALTPAAQDTLDAHFRLEAALAVQATERLQRRASVAAESRRNSQWKEAAAAAQPEVDDDADGFDEGDGGAEGSGAEGSGAEGCDDEAQDNAQESDDDGWDHDDALRFPRSLHRVLALLTHDKPTRDTLRRLSATRISPDAATLIHVLTDLIVLRDRALATTPEQDAAQQLALRDAHQRLVELNDDAAQLRFELAAQREARQSHALTSVATIAKLREQLSETQRYASEALRATQRTRDQDAQALRTQFETDSVRVREQALALARVEGRVDDAHQAEETDDRRRVARAVIDRRELLATYDDELQALDDAIDAATEVLVTQESDLCRLATYFERVDDDRHNQLTEQRARADEAARRRRQELNLFKFTLRLQAIVRGFLTRRRVRLDEKLLRTRKKTKKNKNKKKKKSITKTKQKTRASSTSPRKPTRPTSASSSSTTTARRGRPVSAATKP